jgi:AraC family transcriptional regulator of adaptative response/methylated-DNA-[protein]-cysteine methyltransferase
MSDEDKWQVVLDRDARYDGSFVYAVRSTGVYCRPSCPSKRPRRDQVEFFPVPQAAEQAGYRPCRRCNPSRTAQVGEPYLEIVRRVRDLIEECLNCDGRPTLAELGRQVGLSPFHLQRIFKRVMGVSPRQYAEIRRLERLKTRLKEGDNVTRAMYDAGYNSTSRLYERTPAGLGMTPAKYRRGGSGVRIAYTVVDCPLGKLLIATTERGVCAVSLGDSLEALERALSEEYPAAHIHRDDEGLGPWVELLLDYLEGRQRQLDLPLDVQATAFQWRVWRALQAIPYGTTRTYGQIAQALGQPGAAMAVGAACAANRVALAIPCHRVVREDGGVGGYRWGPERKQALLAREQAVERATAHQHEREHEPASAVPAGR